MIQIPDPCDEGWDNMSGDERVRFCERCQKSVVNLSEMTDSEVRKALKDAPRQGGLCVHVLRTQEGTLFTRTTQQQRLVTTLRALADLRKKKP